MIRTRAVREQFSLIAVFLVLAGLAAAQSPAPQRGVAAQNTTPQQSGAPEKNDQQQPTYRVTVRLVNVFTTVTDSHGAPVGGLAKDDFRILEDGIPQSISVFDRESAVPLSIALEVDTSPSTQREFKLEVNSAHKFVRSLSLRPVDRLSLFQVTEYIDQLTNFTSNLSTIEKGIDALRVGVGTSIYDAIVLGSESLIDRDGRKVLVLITDGGDTTSKATYQDALRRAQQSEAIVYSIIIVPVEADAGRNLGGEHALIQISKDTGGKYYYASGGEQLDEAFRQISDELRTQYLLAYYPNRQRADSSFRRIQVEVVKKDGNGGPYQARHRAGYFTAPAK
jgi:Ca-activated chloride channel homolog